MEDNNTFDDYIKGILNEETPVPDGFEWEEMNIQIPPAPTEQKKKRFILFFILLIGISIAFPFIEITPSQENVFTTIQEVKQPTLNTETPTTPSGTTHASYNVASTPTTAPTLLTENLQSLKSNSKSTLFVKDSPIHSNRATASELTFSQTETKFKTEPMTFAAGEQVTSSNNEINAMPLISESTALLPLEELTLQTIEIKEETNALKGIPFFIDYSVLQPILNIASTNPLYGKIQSGISYRLGLGSQLQMKNNWKANIQIQYSRYHTTFQHSKTLLPIIDLENKVKINREEVTYHNNFTNVLGLQLGLGKSFLVSKKVEAYAGLSLRPNYVLSARGKTYKDDKVAFFQIGNDVERFALSSTLNLGLSYPINNSIDLGVNYQYERFIMNNLFINEGLAVNQQHNLSFQVIYRIP